VRDIGELLDVPKSTVHNVIARFKETGTNERRAGSGRPRTARTVRNMRRIIARIGRNPNSRKNSLRKMGKALGIGRMSVRRIIVNDIGAKSRKKARGQSLNENSRQKRLDRCKRLKQRFCAGRHRKILFTDEKLFDVEQSFNPQNHRDWSVKPLPLEQRIVARQQKPKQVMVWAGVHWKYGKTPLVFVPDGQRMDGKIYRDMLENSVFPWVGRTFQSKEGWTFQQDGAPSHKAEETQVMIGTNCPSFISVDISPKRANGEWPPSSPDLSPMDYSIWGILQEEACSNPHQSVQALKESLIKAWDKIPLETVQKAVDDFPKRLSMCIGAKGGYFEKK